MTAGNVLDGIAWIERNFLETVSYDHAAGAGTRFGPRVNGQKFPSSSTVRLADCSGVVVRAAVEGGMPRYHQGLPESSGDMDRWADAHPDLLLWSKNGGGKYQTLREAVAHAPRGAVFGIGGYRNGDDGHTGFLLGPGGETLESASSLGGVRYGSIWRFSGAHAVTHLYLLPMFYGAVAPTTGDEFTMDKAASDAFAQLNAKIDTALAFEAEFKAQSRKAGDPPHVAAGKMILDLHEFALTEHKAEIIAALEKP